MLRGAGQMPGDVMEDGWGLGLERGPPLDLSPSKNALVMIGRKDGEKGGQMLSVQESGSSHRRDAEASPGGENSGW